MSRAPGVRRAVVTVKFGDISRTVPLTSWGSGRGQPVDRWYIERYLEQHSDLVHGRVLEVKADAYASRFGAAEVEIVDIDPANERAAVIGDLCDPNTLTPGRYDGAIVTQTLQSVDDPAAVVRNVLSALRPGGALLLTVPCLSRVIDDHDRWRWTPSGFAQLVSTAVPPGAQIDVLGLGNGLAARAFLFGLATEDLEPAALAVEDDDYPLVVGACVRPAD